MLRTLTDLTDYAIRATDGDIGHVKDFYFDDETWAIRYLVVDTGGWLANRKVLISPIAIGTANWADKVLPVAITREQVRNSPDIDTDKPVSRQHEMMYLGYYGYPYYWGGAGLWGMGPYPGMLAGAGSLRSDAEFRAARSAEDRIHSDAAGSKDNDHHLRSCKAVTGYHIVATDGDIGHVQSLLVDEESWAIRYLVVNTSNWWLGHEVLITPRWIKDVSWSSATVTVDLSRQAIKDAPPYNSATQMDRKLETDIHEHYGRPGYWADDAKRASAMSQR
ncbi:MAG: PRC-barrel domain-containing protein [Gammaproteobacteria bacterium]